MRIILVLLLFISVNAQAQDGGLFSISFGPVKIAESRIPLDLNDFKIIKNLKKLKAEAYFEKKSVQWVRSHNNLLTPRAKLKISFHTSSPNIHIKYQSRTIIPTFSKSRSSAQLYVSLFNPSDIEVFINEKKAGQIEIEATVRKGKSNTQLIDYSCSRYNVKIKGLDNEYLSLGCRLDRIGKWGKEKPQLEISWASTNFRLQDGSLPPYVSILTENHPIKATVIDKKGNKKEIEISATIPSRLTRLKTAFGLGPYSFRTEQDTKARSPKVAPAFMLYGNLYLQPGASIRMFDAVVFQDSIFNNFGFYFAYDLADAFDRRVQFVPLLGIQGLSFKYNKNDETFTHAIYPQGFEVVYNHAFGIENYLVVYGMFLSTSSQVDYSNIWLRWGKKHFWELNYIKWGANNRVASMYGLSIGFPLISLF